MNFFVNDLFECIAAEASKLLAAGTFGDGVFGQFTGEKEPDGGLDLPGGEGGSLVVVGQFRSLGGNTLKQIIDEGVHDAHGLGGDTGIGVDLLQHLVDVDGMGLLTLVFAFLGPKNFRKGCQEVRKGHHGRCQG